MLGRSLALVSAYGHAQMGTTGDERISLVSFFLRNARQC